MVSTRNGRNDSILYHLGQLLPSQIVSAEVASSISPDVLRIAEDHWVAPLLAHRVAGEPWRAVPCAQVRDTLRKHLCYEAGFELMTRREVHALITDCAEIGIDLLVMKGAALAYTHYPAPHVRPRLDTDVLIAADDRARMHALLYRRGYTRVPAISGRAVVHQAEYTRELPGGLAHSVDVHWKIANPAAFADLFTFAELRKTGARVPQLGDAAWTPAPVETLLLLAIHRMAHHERDLDLLCMFDVHLVAEQLSAAEWRRLVAMAEERGLTQICAEAVQTARDVVPTAVPAFVEAWIARNAGAPVPRRFAAFARRDRRVADVIASDLRVLDGWRARANLLREHLLPPASYMRARYPQAPRWALPYWYAHRIVAGVPRALRRGRFR